MNIYGEERRYFETDDAVGAVLPYDDDRLTLAVIMPEGDFDEWREGFGYSEFVSTIDSANMEHFSRFALPKFLMESREELITVLVELGITDVFSPTRAQFTGLSSGRSSLYVGDVFQIAKIDVDEEGTTAAAVTEVTVEFLSAPMYNEKELIFNQPFLYSIVDTETNLPLFIGTFE